MPDQHPVKTADVTIPHLDPTLSSAETVDHLLNRIGEVDAAGPCLGSIIETNPEAMALAIERDAERRDERVRGPLHGAAIVVKDNIDTDDAMLTTAGSLALCTSRPQQDAPVVTRLREAGMVILGKTNLSEWANFRSSHSTSGWSGRGGLTRNPWDLERSAGGSSSGSGAAVAAGLAPFALGTETDGSIICPASFNGIVGLKPTVGLLPQAGIVPIAHSQDTAGPMARSVAAVAVLLDVLVASDRHAAAASDPRGVREIRLGVLRPFFGSHPASDAVAETAIAVLSRGGATIVDDLAYPEQMGSLDDDEMTVLLHEFKHDLDAYLGQRIGDGPTSMAEVIAFNRAHADRELSWFGQELLEQAVATTGLDDSAYVEARRRGVVASRDHGIDALLRDHELDALIAPCYPPASMTDLVNGDPEMGGDVSHAPAVAGYPVISVPMGLVHDLPVGLAVTGTAGSEPMLLRVAAAVESGVGLLAAGALTPPL